MNRLSKSILISILVSVSTVAAARDIGTYGAIYPITEKDALSEIEARAREIDWKKVLDPKEADKRIKGYRPVGLSRLPLAKKDRAFNVDMTYSVEMDIPDGQGGILYPKGYTFNPLEYVFLPNILVFLDGSDKRQIEWFKRSPYNDDYRTMLLLTDGAYYEIMRDLKTPVYYANPKIIERFRVESVPSVAVQKGKLMEIREYLLTPSEEAGNRR
jgi:conjugal transfer pilus assembly protein TraW